MLHSHFHFHSLVETITEASDLSEVFNVMTSRLIILAQEFQNHGSGWQFDKVEIFDILIDPLNLYPRLIADKNAIINVKNENDNACFKLAITSAIYTAKNHPERLNKKMRVNSDKFNWKGIDFPVSLKQIDKFKKQNPYAVNVFRIKGGNIFSIKDKRSSRQRHHRLIVDLE